MTAIIILNSISAIAVGYLCGRIAGTYEKRTTRVAIGVIVGVCFAVVLTVAMVRAMG